jgi:hypothetical protein
MKFSNKVTAIKQAFCAALILLISVNSCTEVNDGLGEDLLPKNQKMTLRINKLGGVKIFTQKQDSVISGNFNEVSFGKVSDPTFGSRVNSFIVQFLPSTLPYDGKGYGLDPIVDSLILTLPLTRVDGDYDVEQSFKVYAIEWKDDQSSGPDSLSVDSTYYTFFSPAEYYDASRPLFTFTHSGKKGIDKQLIPTPEGEAYLKSIVDFNPNSYDNNALFRKKYKGFYITPDETSPSAAAVYGSSLYYETAGLTLYARNHDTIDRSKIYDTVMTAFSFYDLSSEGEDFRNVSINVVDWDYSGTPIEEAFELTKNDTPQSVAYVQPMSGAMTRLEFTDELVNTLRDLRNQTDSEGNTVMWPNIMINQAVMYVYLKDDSTLTLDSSMKRVGSYLNANTLAYTPDYLFSYEASYQQTDETYMLPYNGYLDRSLGYYKMDITSYIQQLAKEVEEGKKAAISQTVYLASDAYSFFLPGQSVIQNGDDADKQIEIKITYTLID